MKTSFVSTSAISQALRYQLSKAQAELTRAQKEVQTGRVADIGLALGTKTSISVSFTRDMDRMSGIIDSNALVSARLSATQNALSQVSSSAQTYLSALTNASSGSGLSAVTQDAAQTMLDQLTTILNQSFNGEQLFAGINTDVKPLTNYSAAGSPAKAAFDTAFLAHFGFAQSDPAAANISNTAMSTFIDTVVTPQFFGAGWAANWSSATDQSIVSRITLNETTSTSVSANNDGIRGLMMAATMVADLFDSQVGAGGREALISKAVSLVGESIGKLANLQAMTGISEKRVKDASERLQMQVDLYETQLGKMVGVDPYEASTRVTDLLSHIETSYALTARIQQLSILRFIS